MNQALLLLAEQRVVAAVKIGHEHSPELLEQILEERRFPVGPVHVQDILQVRQDPDISLAFLQVGVRLIGVNQSTLQNPVEDSPASRTETPGHQGFQHVKLLEANPQAEAFLEHGREVLQAHAMDNVLVHGPAFQSVLVLVEPLVPSG